MLRVLLNPSIIYNNNSWQKHTITIKQQTTLSDSEKYSSLLAVSSQPLHAPTLPPPPPVHPLWNIFPTAHWPMSLSSLEISQWLPMTLVPASHIPTAPSHLTLSKDHRQLAPHCTSNVQTTLYLCTTSAPLSSMGVRPIQP